MSIFDFTLKHVPGTKIKKIDRLSRKPNWKVKIENDNKNKNKNRRMNMYFNRSSCGRTGDKNSRENKRKR